MAIVMPNQLRKEFARRPALRRRLVQGRAPRPALARRPERGRQERPAPDARPGAAGGGRWRARVLQGNASRSTTSARRSSRAALREYVLSGAADLIALEEELRSLEQAMAAGDHDQATRARYADAQARLEHAGGYAWRDRRPASCGAWASRTLTSTGSWTRSQAASSRASLARALAGDPDLLLLDEPTNHLDVESIEWLERELQSLDAAVILVAHDRWFLEAVTNGVLELLGRPLALLQGHGTSGVWRRRHGRNTPRRRSTGSTRTSPVSSASWSGSATRRTRPSRPRRS